MIIKIVLFVLMLTIFLGVIRGYNKELRELQSRATYYKKLADLNANTYNNLASQIFDIERDEENKITYQKIKEPFKGYILEDGMIIK
jgi:hypothetical protein